MKLVAACCIFSLLSPMQYGKIHAAFASVVPLYPCYTALMSYNTIHLFLLLFLLLVCTVYSANNLGMPIVVFMKKVNDKNHHFV